MHVQDTFPTAAELQERQNRGIEAQARDFSRRIKQRLRQANIETIAITQYTPLAPENHAPLIAELEAAGYICEWEIATEKGRRLIVSW